MGLTIRRARRRTRRTTQQPSAKPEATFPAAELNPSQLLLPPPPPPFRLLHRQPPVHCDLCLSLLAPLRRLPHFSSGHDAQGRPHKTRSQISRATTRSSCASRGSTTRCPTIESPLRARSMSSSRIPPPAPPRQRRGVGVRE